MASTEDRKRDAFQRIALASRRLLDLERRPVPRDQHPKAHGCVRARFVIAPRPEDAYNAYREGLFEHARGYDAWVRFSNGRQRDDRLRDVHGMSIKLTGVDGAKALANPPDGRVQDFVLVDHEVFFLKGAEEYAEFSEAVLKASGKDESTLREILGAVLPDATCTAATLGLLYFFPWRLRTFGKLKNFTSNRIANPLDAHYFSTTPYRFGETHAKFSAVPVVLPEALAGRGAADVLDEDLVRILGQAQERPAPATNFTPEHNADPNYLADALSRTIKAQGAVFVFRAQLYRDRKTTPVDDPTVKWRSQHARHTTLAYLWIPKQEVTKPDLDAFGEGLSFNPWHALDAHRPVGEINEVRRLVYLELSHERHAANGVAAEGSAAQGDASVAPEGSAVQGQATRGRWGNDPTAFPTVLEAELNLISLRRSKVEDRPSESNAEDQSSESTAEDQSSESTAEDQSSESTAEDQSSESNAEDQSSESNAKNQSPESTAEDQSSESNAEDRSPGESIPTSPQAPPGQPGDEDERTKQLRLRALREHVTGLAFSGGGIRSGTFAVGFLQGLASLGLIRRFDYLSTVSGGGYAGAWLAAWLRREGGDPENVEKMLCPSRVEQAKARRGPLLNQGDVVDEEPEAVRHLRAYSSYMFPRPGVFSADAWTVVLIWLRNVTINLLMILPAAMFVVVLARLGVFLYNLFNPAVISPQLRLVSLVLMGLGVVAGAVALYNNGRALWALRDRRGNRHDSSLRALGSPEEVLALVRKGILNPLTIAAVLLTMSIRPVLWTGVGDAVAELKSADVGGGGLVSIRSIVLDAVQSQLGLLEWPMFLLAAVISGLLMWWRALSSIPPGHPVNRGVFGRAAFAAGATGGVLFVLLAALVREFARWDRSDLMATLAAPLALLVVVASLIVLVGLLGRCIDEGEREWWARISALMTLRAVTGVGLMATILYIPGLFLASGPWLRAAIASGWLGSAAFGYLSGRFVLPKAGGGGALGLTALASIASQIFLVGLMGLVALLASLLANSPGLTSPSADDLGPFAYYIRGVNGADPLVLAVVGVIAVALLVLARDLIDVNVFSLNAMYANRLTRCYLGASRRMADWVDRWRLPRDLRADAGAPSLSHQDGPVREPNPLTSFDAFDDDLELSTLRIGAEDTARRAYLGPHLLINTTLNLVGDDSLLNRNRKGESFLLSPLYCGSRGVGYSRLDASTERGNVEPNMTLGRAISISGAAVDPNMSFYQSGPLTALLTIFNARLGYWIEKPRPVGWTAKSPKFGDLFFTEFFGRTDARGDFVHISDGGHFENMGVYELIRRRCRYIVALDAGEDGDPSDDNLANLIRLCRIDFGVRLKLDTSPLTMEGPDRLTRSHVVIGTIHYEDVDRGEMPGVLVYVKISLTGDEPPDIQKYARKDTRFPHQPTDLRQSFDEEQFECYRCLGDHIARDVFADPVDQVREHFRRGPKRAEKASHNDFVPRFFAAVQERWAEAPEGLSELYAEGNEAWAQIQRDIARDPDLTNLSADLYPELNGKLGAGAAGGGGATKRAELHMVARMLAVMENAWIELSLKRTSSLPINRGWMNAFRRWVGSRAFRRTWPVLRSEYSTEFVRFCEEQLHLVAARPSAVPLAKSYDQLAEDDPQRLAIDLIDDEFAREWPDEHRRGRGPRALVKKAAELRTDPAPAWLIVQAPSGPADAAHSPEGFVCGIIIAAKTEPPAEVTAAAKGQKCVEFFTWVRRAYRSAGLGGQCVREVLEEAAQGFALWARYPEINPGDDDLEYMTFLRFFSRFDFRPVELDNPAKADGMALLRPMPR